MRTTLLLASLLLAAACGPTKPVIPCVRACHADYDCPPGEPNPNCEAALADCLDECQMAPKENEGKSGEGE